MKISKYDITFDSELELNYYDYLKDNKVPFVYQSDFKKSIDIRLGRRKTYRPDFVTYDDDNKTVTIVEMKGYAKWTANEDNNIMDFMLHKVETDQEFLIKWLKENDIYKENYRVLYKRLKFIKGIGFVDYKYKNPNTLLNKRKVKIEELEKENRELKKRLKEYEKYYQCLKKEKLTKKQIEWCARFESTI